MINLTDFIILSAMLFCIGCLGILFNQHNLIKILMSSELILLAVNINLVAFSSFKEDIAGQIFSLFVLCVAAAEAAIGLAIVVIYYRNRQTISLEDGAVLKG